MNVAFVLAACNRGGRRAAAAALHARLPCPSHPVPTTPLTPFRSLCCKDKHVVRRTQQVDAPRVRLVVATLKPRAEAQRWYMRSSMAAQSIASTPPAPDCEHACIVFDGSASFGQRRMCIISADQPFQEERTTYLSLPAWRPSPSPPRRPRRAASRCASCRADQPTLGHGNQLPSCVYQQAAGEIAAQARLHLVRCRQCYLGCSA